VAKGSSGKVVKAQSGDARISPIIKGLDLFYPILVDCDLDWSVTPESTDTETLERFYDSAIRLIDDSVKQKTTIAACQFSAGQKIKEKKVFEIQATYLIAVGHSDGGRDVLSKFDRKKLLEETATTSAWPLFRALFVHMGSQTNLDLPFLPNIPKLRWLKPGEGPAKEKQST
jgi:hypothetical protein